MEYNVIATLALAFHSEEWGYTDYGHLFPFVIKCMDHVL